MLKINYKFLAIGIIFILAVGGIGFYISSTQIENTTHNEPKSIKIGTILGLTGENSAYGVRMKKGLDLALEELNTSNFFDDKKVDLIVEDSQWEPKLGVNSYRKLHDIQGVKYYTAICGSKIALAVAEASRSDDIVIVDAISGAPALTTKAGPKYFRVYASDAVAGKYNIDWALEEGALSFAVIYVEDDWGASYKDAVVSQLEKHNIVPTTIPINLGTRDFRPEVSKIINANPDAVFVLMYANLSAPFIKQARSAGLAAKLYGGDNLSSSDFTAIGNDVIEDVRLSLPAEIGSEKFDSFREAYSTKFSEEPDSFALKSYDSLMLLANAIKNTNGEPSSIIEFLHKMPPYSGASGSITFDDSGDLITQKYDRMVYRNGLLTPFD